VAPGAVRMGGRQHLRELYLGPVIVMFGCGCVCVDIRVALPAACCASCSTVFGTERRGSLSLHAFHPSEVLLEKHAWLAHAMYGCSIGVLLD
jgi:hypothetical protein